jgi:signal transduction histidine kinase
MKHFIALVLFFSFAQTIVAQIPAPDLSKANNLKEKLDLWNAYCNELMASGEESEYKRLAIEAKKGIQLVPDDSIRVQAMFNLFAGVAYEYTKDYNNAIHHYNRCNELCRKINKISYEITSLSRLDGIYNYINNIPKRKEVMNRMLQISRTTNDLDVKYKTEDVLSGYYRDINDYEKSIDFKIKASETYRQLVKSDSTITEENANINIGIDLGNIGNIFNEVGQYEKALEYLHEAQNYIGENAFRGNEEALYVFMIQAFLGLNKTDSAYYYYKKSYQKMAGRDTIYNSLFYINHMFGEYYLKQNNIDSANYFAQKAFWLSKKSLYKDSEIMGSNLMGNVYYRQKKYKPAIQLLTVALDNDFEFNKQQKADLHKTLADCYEQLSRWDSAYFHFKIYSELKDTIMQGVANQNFAEAEARYQNKEKRHLIEEKNIKLAAAQKEKIWLISGLLLAALSIVLLVVIYRNRNKYALLMEQNNAKLSELNRELDLANKTKATLFGIISHDLRSPLSQVYNFLRLQQRNSDVLNLEQKAELSKRIQQSTENLLETMEDLLLWSKSQMNEFVPKYETVYLSEEIQQSTTLLQLMLDAKNVKIQHQIPETITLQTDRNFLATILRNLLQNAAKASPNGSEIIISTEQHSAKTILTIENSGGTFTQQQFEAIVHEDSAATLSGLGLQLVATLAQKINVSIRFLSKEEGKTVVELRF